SPSGACCTKRQSDVLRSGAALDRREDGFGFGHLGHSARADETTHLDARKTTLAETIDQLDAFSHRQDAGLVLESVPWADFAHDELADRRFRAGTPVGRTAQPGASYCLSW